jgi:signal transduction histidine kinase
MRRLLGVLRSEQTTAQHAPQPDLGEVPALVDAARRAGVRVRLSVPGRAPRVPATVGVCGYRIVQESLSNAGRHAPGAAVEVMVEYAADAVRLSVVNGPGRGGAPLPAAAGPPGGAQPTGRPGGGHGLTGMGERVALLGGELSARPTAEGGFAVRAVLPLEVSP